MWLAPSKMGPNDPHLLVFICLCSPSPFVCGLDVVTCFYQREYGKSDGMSLLKLGYKDYDPLFLPLALFYPSLCLRFLSFPLSSLLSCFLG